MKYELAKDLRTKEFTAPDGTKHTLYRVRALEDFETFFCDEIREGDIGGWIESEANLSQDDVCWVMDEGIVCQEARVQDEAVVRGHAVVYDATQLNDNAEVEEDAVLHGAISLYDRAGVRGHANISGIVSMSGHSTVVEDAVIQGDHAVFLDEYACIAGNTLIIGGDCTVISGSVLVEGNSKLTGKISLDGSIVLEDVTINASENNRLTLSGTFPIKKCTITDRDDFVSMSNLYAICCFGASYHKETKSLNIRFGEYVDEHIEGGWDSFVAQIPDIIARAPKYDSFSERIQHEHRDFIKYFTADRLNQIFTALRVHAGEA